MQNSQGEEKDSNPDVKAEDRKVGYALGPGNTESQFRFVTREGNDLKVGEYVYYEREDGSSILCRIEERDRFSGGVSLPQVFVSRVPEEFMSAVETNDTHVLDVLILGVYDAEIDKLRNVHKSPSTGEVVYMIPDDSLARILNPSEERGHLHIGNLLTRPGDSVKIHIDMEELTSNHVSILASTGSGKSYTAGVMIEEMLKQENRGTSVVFDVHGEYGTFADSKYSDRVNHVRAPRIKVSNLTPEDLEVGFEDSISHVQRELLKNVVNDMDLGKPLSAGFFQSWRDAVRTNYSLQDLIEEFSPEHELDSALRWRLASMLDFSSLDSEVETTIEELCEPGTCTIIEFPPTIDERERNLIFWYFTRKIIAARKAGVREKKGQEINYSSYGIEDTIKTPATLFVEESHNFAPSDRNIPTRRLLKNVAREGRKLGVGLCVISQRPSGLDEDVLSQCNSSVISRIRNVADQNAIVKSVEGVGKDLLQDLPALTVGQVALVGNFVNTPILARVRERETEHGGVTPSVYEDDGGN